ncbi:hypothetical protein BJX70DRAFT_155734 [Aspergillus crustosus]
MGSTGNSFHMIPQVIESYREGNHPSRHSSRKVAERLTDLLKQESILHDIGYGTIEVSRLEGELNVRQMVRRNQNVQTGNLENDVVDLAGVSIYVHLPSDKARVRKIIQDAFTIHWPENGSEMETDVGHTEFCTEYFWVTLEEESRRLPWRLVEIQLAADPGDEPLKSQSELGVFLGRWAAARGRREDPGEVQTLWELVTLLNLCHPRDLQKVLEPLDVSPASDSDFADRARDFKPLELGLAMYVTDSMIKLRPGKILLNENVDFLKQGSEVERQRYKMEVIRDSIIWLSHLRSWGAGAAKVLLGDLDKAMQDRQRQRIAWLDHPEAKCFFDRRKKRLLAHEVKDLEELWRMFEKNQQLPAQYVFSLARLRVRGPTQPTWPVFRKAISDLVYG